VDAIIAIAISGISRIQPTTWSAGIINTRARDGAGGGWVEAGCERYRVHETFTLAQHIEYSLVTGRRHTVQLDPTVHDNREGNGWLTLAE